jgi:CheY-like chemotaxis protein
MPQLSGLDLIKKLTDHVVELNRGHKNIRVKPPIFILTSAYLTPSLRKQIFEFGVSYIYQKPLMLSELTDLFSSSTTLKNLINDDPRKISTNANSFGWFRLDQT